MQYRPIMFALEPPLIVLELHYKFDWKCMKKLVIFFQIRGVFFTSEDNFKFYAHLLGDQTLEDTRFLKATAR